jgi:hypothetical protein
MSEHDIAKALEVWGLQSLLDISILLGIVACGLAMIQGYYKSLEKHLSLRVSIELWKVLTIALVDVLLAIVVMIGYLVLNPDIMADIKMAVPFQPLAIVLFSAALVIRLFHGGHDPQRPSFLGAVCLMFVASVVSIIGFTFVAEAPSGEYLATHPSPFWDYVKTHLRSNADPSGLELSQWTFYVCFPLLVAVFAWGFLVALRRIRGLRG